MCYKSLFVKIKINSYGGVTLYSMNESIVRISAHTHEDEIAQEFLREIDLFKNLPAESFNLFDKRIHRKPFKRGEQIFSEFEEAESIYFVKSGVVKLTKQDENGKEIIVCIKRSGEIFAESCLFNESSYYPATAKMVQDGVIYYLKTTDLEQELVLSPELAVVLIRSMSKSLRGFTSMMRDIALLDVYTKTIRTLGRLTEQFGMNKCHQKNIELPLTVQEFANIIGASRESVSRVFSNLRKEGILDVKGRIIITEWCKLCPIYQEK